MQLNEEQLLSTVNNPESREDAIKRGTLLISGMHVGTDWEIKVWKQHDWHYELFSNELHIKMYPTWDFRLSQVPCFSVSFFGWEYSNQDVRVRDEWEKQQDPNEAVIQLIKKFKESVDRSVSFSNHLMEKAGLCS